MSGRGASPRGRVGALAVLAAGFALSAALRAGDVVAALPAAAEDGFGHALPGAEGVEGQTGTDRAEALVAELAERRAAVTERAAELDAREQTLEAVEARLRARLDELEAAREELEATAAVIDDAAGRDVRHLAAMYQRMKPKEAAAIFDRMAPSFAAGFLAEMEPDSAALVLANMAPDRAYAVSLLLAGRNLEAGGGSGLQPSLRPAP